MLTVLAALLLLLAFFWPPLLWPAKIATIGLAILVVVDLLLLYLPQDAFFARRTCADRLSNGDDNNIDVYLENRYKFDTKVTIIDEVPFQFQARDKNFKTNLSKVSEKQIRYTLHPTERGEYSFGALNVFVRSPIGLLMRRYQFAQDKMVPVYPSYIQMRKYELMAISNRLHEYGIKKIRRIGHSMEFEQIKEYVGGDDYRTVNWKASARTGKLMINQFQDEKSQRVYAVIDKGRTMRFPFEGMTLLDYAINASLVICNIAIKKSDRAGLVTINSQLNAVLKANKLGGQMKKIQELLYRERSDFEETDFGKLYSLFRTRLSTRSLILLFTNFTSMSGLQRRLPYLRKIARGHVLVVIFFQDTELSDYLKRDVGDLESVYQKVVGERFASEKRQIARELEKYGIQAVLTEPENLTVDTINKYLELKARGMI